MSGIFLLPLQILISVVTIFLSTLGASFTAGKRVRRIETVLHNIEERFARIETLLDYSLDAKREI